MELDLSSLRFGWFCRANIEVLVDLSRVRRNNFARDPFRYLRRGAGFANGSRTYYSEDTHNTALRIRFS